MKEISILYSSYDDYQDLLPIAYHFYNKFCSEFKYKVYWGSNGYIIDSFKSIAPNWSYIYKSSCDLGWSKNLKTYLEEIDTEYVLLLLDDFLFIDKPDISDIENAFALMIEKDAVYMRLNNKPKPNKQINNIFGYIEYYSDYRSSLQPAIWKKDILLKLCDYDFNPWLFERKAGIVDEIINMVFLGTYKDIIKINHCVEKGMWIDYMFDKIKQENLKVSNKRKVWDSSLNAESINKTFREKIINRISSRLLFHLRKILKKGIFSDEFQGHSHK